MARGLGMGQRKGLEGGWWLFGEETQKRGELQSLSPNSWRVVT